MSIDQAGCATAIQDVMDRVLDTQRDNISASAELVAESLAAGGVVQAFGTGHSQGLSMEIAGRAGGFVPTNMLAIRDIVIYGGVKPADVDRLVERDPAVAHQIYDLATTTPEDVFVIGSNSGGNGSVVEMAQLVRERGHRVIAITSLAHSTRIESRHPSGKRLFELADVVIDNCAPYGDSLLPLAGGGSVCAVSSITSALAAQMMVAEVVARQLAAGVTPPVYLSANVPGGDEHNDELEARYAGRIRRGIS
jgi:uncharacterized phosphosugar-binding protein